MLYLVYMKTLLCSYKSLDQQLLRSSLHSTICMELLPVVVKILSDHERRKLSLIFIFSRLRTKNDLAAGSNGTVQTRGFAFLDDIFGGIHRPVTTPVTHTYFSKISMHKT
jgi:hypothetical protein